MRCLNELDMKTDSFHNVNIVAKNRTAITMLPPFIY